MSSVVDILKRQVEAWRSIGHLPLLDEFILRNGKPYIAAKYKGARGVPKECFKNACDLHEARPNLVYVEGYALRHSLCIPMHHAWLADPKTHEVVDPTWNNPEACDYFGVPFTREETITEVLRNGVYGLLNLDDMLNDKLMFARDPGLGAIFEERVSCPKKTSKPPAKRSAKSTPSSKTSTKKRGSRSSARPSPR